MLAASLSAYLVDDFINDKVFQKMKQQKASNFSIRAIVSSVCGEIVDSAIFIPIAFIGQMPTRSLVIMGVTQVSIKLLYELAILPITNTVVRKVREYEGS